MAILVLISAIYLATVYFASAESVTEDWQKNAAATTLDILKIAVGAAIGALTTAAGAVAQVFTKTEDASD